MVRSFAIFSLSMMNHNANFNLIVILGHMKKLNGSGFARGDQKIPYLMMNGMDFFTNISKYIRNK